MRFLTHMLFSIIPVFLLAACSREENLQTEVQTELYEFHLICNEKEFEEIYADWENDRYIPVAIVYKGDTIPDAKMRIRGDTSREKPKKSLKVKFGSRTFEGYKDVINFNAEYSDKSYIRQYMSGMLMRQAGLHCFDSEFSVLYLNGRFFGLYLMVENVDNDFMQKHNLDPANNLYKAKDDGACLSVYDVIDKDWEKKTNVKTGFDDLQLLIGKVNSTSVADYYEFVTKNFEYDKFLTIIAMDMLLANGSTWYHNYYLYHDRQTGKWEIFPWDLDKTLSYYDWMPYAYHRTSSNWESDNPLIEKSLLNEKIFADIRKKIDELHQSFVNIEFTEPVIGKLELLIADAVGKDTTDNITDAAAWHKTLENERNFFRNHYTNLQKHFDNWPRSFEVIPTEGVVSGEPLIRWFPSSSPAGKDIRYKLYYSTSFLLEDDTSKLKLIDNITDTFVVIPGQLDEKIWYWKVVATDGETETEGFNTRNFFDYRQPTELPEKIDKNLTLDEGGSPYIVRNDVHVAPGVTFTVKEGVELWFLDTVNIYVGGNMIVTGTAEKPVLLKPYRDDACWGWIYIENQNSTCKFDHVVFEEGVLRSKYADLTVTNSSFNIVRKKLHYSQEHRELIIWVHKGKFTFRNNIINGNGEGEGMNVNYASAVVENNHIINTPDAIEYINVTDGLIKDNLVEDSPDDAIDLNGCSNVRITGNTLINNKDKAISVGTEQYGPSRGIIIDHNLIIKNGIAVAVKDSSQAFITNNTLFKNIKGVCCYLKRPGYTIGGEAIIKNTIFDKCTEKNIECDKASKLEISYSCSHNEVFQGTGNIKADPKFINAAGMNFYSAIGSTCTKAGENGLYIGAFNPQGSLPVINEFSYAGNSEADEGDWIELYNPASVILDLSGWKISDGKDSYSFPEGTLIYPHGRLLLVSSGLKFRSVYPLLRVNMCETGFPLSSKGEQLALSDNTGTLIDAVQYSADEKWPVDDRSGSFSLGLKDIDKDNNNGSNWILMHESSPGY